MEQFSSFFKRKISGIKITILHLFLYFYLNTIFWILWIKSSALFWGVGKLPRIRKTLLQKSRLSRGLALPNFQRYYRAAHMQKKFFWINSHESPWCKLQLLSCTSSSIYALLLHFLSNQTNLIY